MNRNILALLKMLQSCDSMFPIGQFTLSNGLESFVLENKLNNPTHLKAYIKSYLAIAPFNDVLLLRLAFEGQDVKALDTLAFAAKAPYEVRIGSQKLAKRFMKMWQDIEKSAYPALMNYMDLMETEQCKGIFPIAVGLYAKDLELDLQEASSIFLYSQLSAIVTNAVKTVPLSQAKGQLVLNEALEEIPAVIEKAFRLTLDDFGVGGAMFDIESMRHEYLYSRQYMS